MAVQTNKRNSKAKKELKLADTAEELEILMQQREDFVATLTHDLKTPVTAANRAIELLLQGDFGYLQDSQTEVLRAILDSNSAMLQLLTTLLDVYKYENGAKQLCLQPSNISEIVRQIVEMLRPVAESNRLTFQIEVSSEQAEVICDADEIRRLVQNLVDNALKYTPAGGRTTVEVKQSSTHTCLVVRDTGRGISDDNKANLFKRFWTPPLSGRNYASTGLGLYLCRRIVELHGGQIRCESELGKGSSFFVTLPNDPSYINEIERIDSKNTGKNQIRVLIVDDQPLIRTGISLSFSSEPTITIVGEAGSAKEAEIAAAELQPDIILMDISLPDGDGIDLTSAILARNKNTRVIMLTSHSAQEYVDRAVAAGAAGYCNKGLRAEELSQIVSMVYSGEKCYDRL